MDSRNEAVLGRQVVGSPEAQVCCLQYTPGPAFALEEAISHPNTHTHTHTYGFGITLSGQTKPTGMTYTTRIVSNGYVGVPECFLLLFAVLTEPSAGRIFGIAFLWPITCFL